MNQNYVPPLSREGVEAMGLTLGPLCEQKHGVGMQPHHHIALKEGPAQTIRSHGCPVCGDVHVPQSPPEVMRHET